MYMELMSILKTISNLELQENNEYADQSSVGRVVKYLKLDSPSPTM